MLFSWGERSPYIASSCHFYLHTTSPIPLLPSIPTPFSSTSRRSCGGYRFGRLSTIMFPPASIDASKAVRSSPLCPNDIISLRRSGNPRSFSQTTIKQRPLNPRLFLIFLALTVLVLGTPVAAAAAAVEENGAACSAVVVEQQLTMEGLVAAIDIHADPGFFHPLARRADPTTSSASSSTTSKSTATATGSPTPTASPSNPAPFDTLTTSLNLTLGCGNFLSEVIGDEVFKKCLPLSGLIRVRSLLQNPNSPLIQPPQDSSAFIKIMKSGAFATTVILDRACSVDLKICTAVMEKYGGQIRQPKTCGPDYQRGNPVVSNAFTDLISYRPLYTAGCLKASNGDYCFVDAVLSDVTADLWIYSLPLGSALPGGSRPK